MEEMKGKTGQEVRNIQKMHYLNETERFAQRLNVSLKVSGATFKGGSRETELNKSISELSETDNGANGVDRYERFLEKYSSTLSCMLKAARRRNNKAKLFR